MFVKPSIVAVTEAISSVVHNNPVSNVVDPGYQEIRGRLLSAVRNPVGLIVLTGAAGVRRTSLPQQLKLDLPATTTFISCRADKLTFSHVVELICRRLSLPARPELPVRLKAIKECLQVRKEHTPLVVYVVEDAHKLSDDGLNRVLIFYQSLGLESALRFIFCGPPELATRLRDLSAKHPLTATVVYCHISLPPVAEDSIADTTVIRLDQDTSAPKHTSDSPRLSIVGQDANAAHHVSNGLSDWAMHQMPPSAAQGSAKPGAMISAEPAAVSSRITAATVRISAAGIAELVPVADAENKDATVELDTVRLSQASLVRDSEVAFSAGQSVGLRLESASAAAVRSKAPLAWLSAGLVVTLMAAAAFFLPNWLYQSGQGTAIEPLAVDQSAAIAVIQTEPLAVSAPDTTPVQPSVVVESRPVLVAPLTTEAAPSEATAPVLDETSAQASAAEALIESVAPETFAPVPLGAIAEEIAADSTPETAVATVTEEPTLASTIASALEPESTPEADAYQQALAQAELIIARAEQKIALAAEALQLATTSSPLPTSPAISSDDYIRLGREMLELNDIASARLYFEAGAEAGDTKCLLAVGMTYDPVILQKRGLLTTYADPDAAEAWYLRAIQAGLSEAGKRLDDLRAAGR